MIHLFSPLLFIKEIENVLLRSHLVKTRASFGELQINVKILEFQNITLTKLKQNII